MRTDWSSTLPPPAPVGEQSSADYCFAEPFPHIVFDNFLPEPVARLALDHFPRHALSSDRVFDMGYAGLHKRQILPEECDAPARQLFHFFNSRPVLEFLEGLTTIQGLIPDPYFVGGGYHETGARRKARASTPTSGSTISFISIGASTSSSTSTRGGSPSGAARSSCGIGT